jgi:hypothetical protein
MEDIVIRDERDCDWAFERVLVSTCFRRGGQTNKIRL